MYLSGGSCQAPADLLVVLQIKLMYLSGGYEYVEDKSTEDES
ncbi:unnamed protein product, partial [marine sediment metagenome]